MGGLSFSLLGAGLAASALLAFLTWIVSVVKRDVSVVDALWSVLIMAPALTVAALLDHTGPRAVWLLPLVGLWALRLALYIGWRNHGQPEDRRYQDIRARNQPGFTWKSLYLVFALQAVLGWIVSLPLCAATASAMPTNWVDALGAVVIAFGLLFEATGDWQLARFKRQGHQGQVMDRGLWRYTRHPNYFGECCVWWGVYLVALSAGAWWSVVSPLLMTVLLLKVSGVALLEKDIGERRPAYRDYIERTSAFLPWLPKREARS